MENPGTKKSATEKRNKYEAERVGGWEVQEMKICKNKSVLKEDERMKWAFPEWVRQ